MAEGTPRSVLKQVNGWRLGNTLGKGGFGHVRLAHHPTGRQAAVKILPALDFSQPISRDALLDAIEAEKEVVLLKMCAGYKMKGVVGLEMVKEEGDWKYLFLPLAPKVASHMRTPSPEATFIPFFRYLLCTLHTLHIIGCTHEDLKPANCLIDDKNNPVLADFGFATFCPSGRRMIGGGGTLDYLSPEKVGGDPYYGPPSDVHACGILFSKWFNEHHPFIHNRSLDSDKTIEDRIEKGEAQWRLPDEPGSPGELLKKMLITDPKQRWTIPQVLAHPFLNPTPSTKSLKPKPLHQPIYPHYDFSPVSDPDPDVLQDLIFLAFCALEWFPCMTDVKIRKKLREGAGTRPWELRTYHALAAWREKDPDKVGTPGPRGLISKAVMKPLIRVMSEVQLGGNKPNVPSPLKETHNNPSVLPRASVAPVSPIKLTQKDKENVLAMPKIEQDAGVGGKKTEMPKAPGPARERVELSDTEDEKEEGEISDGSVIEVKIQVKKPMKVAPPTIKIVKTKAKAKGKVKMVIPQDDDDEGDFLPAPLPKPTRELRRSPRLQGLEPELVGLAAAPRARRILADH